MNVEFNFVARERFSTFFEENRKSIFQSDFDFDIIAVLSEAEKELIRSNGLLFKEVERYYLAAEIDGKIIGWSVGHQLNPFDFFMANSGVLPEYRRQGIYTQMLDIVMKRLSGKGYQMITSKHKMSNNSIIIPKLKYGFVITGFEVSDQFGSIIILSYYTNPKRKELLEIRIGSRKMNLDYLKLVK